MHISAELFDNGYCSVEQDRVTSANPVSLAISAHSLSTIGKDPIYVCQRYPAGGQNEAVTYRRE